MRIRIVDVNGNETTMNVKDIIAIDGKPYESSNSGNTSDRLVLLETHVADLLKFRDAILEHQPEQESPA